MSGKLLGIPGTELWNGLERLATRIPEGLWTRMRLDDEFFERVAKQFHAEDARVDIPTIETVRLVINYNRPRSDRLKESGLQFQSNNGILSEREVVKALSPRKSAKSGEVEVELYLVSLFKGLKYTYECFDELSRRKLCFADGDEFIAFAQEYRGQTPVFVSYAYLLDDEEDAGMLIDPKKEEDRSVFVDSPPPKNRLFLMKRKVEAESPTEEAFRELRWIVDGK